MTVTVHHGDSREVLKGFADASIDSVVCDPPYALVSIGKRFGADNAAPAKAGKSGAYARASAGFMGQKWDTGETAFDPLFWVEVLRVLKPGGHLIAFSGTRTYHRLACAIEDAGFEMRDMIAWLYGSGFPKSHDVSKGIDRAAGATREVTGVAYQAQKMNGGAYGSDRTERESTDVLVTAPATDAARQWQGWGTALKPALEPCVLARKPLGTGGANVLENVERAIRSAGYKGEIVWKPEPVNGAAKNAPRRTSSSTEQPPAAVTSADLADAFETANDGPRTVKSSAPTGSDGPTPTPNETRTAERPPTPDCDAKSSPHTGGAASAAARASLPSSPSTTSRGAEPSIESESTARSMPNCDDSVSPATAIDSFAGIATGLSGSMALVRISRDKSGAFIWPAGLPKSVPSTSLTVAANVLQHGTGALNIDASRIGTDGGAKYQENGPHIKSQPGAVSAYASSPKVEGLGRWPANVIHDGSEEVTGAFPDTGASSSYTRGSDDARSCQVVAKKAGEHHVGYSDPGSAARFFYSAKADAADRLGSKHPTVKPIDLMAYLVRLVTPPGGVTLDPFAGSGSTGMACLREGFDCVLIEREAQYVADIHRRLAHVEGADTPLFASAMELDL